MTASKWEKGAGWITEAAAGMIKKNESPENAARWEVEEETSCQVGKLEHISTCYVSPGGGFASENKDIMTVVLSLTDALKLIQSGQIADAKIIVGKFWLQHHLTENLA